MVDGHETIYAVADEDLDRGTEEKTSAVHFLRFELSPAMVERCKGRCGPSVLASTMKTIPTEWSPIAENVRTALLADLA